MHGTNQRNEHDSTKRSIRLTPPCLPEKRKSGTEARHVETHVVAAAGDYRHTEQGVQQECITNKIKRLRSSPLGCRVRHGAK